MAMLKATCLTDLDGNAEVRLTDSDDSTEDLPDLYGTEDGIDNGSLDSDDIHKSLLDLDGRY
jgi:hypothetical protein